jgi:hypothetical protein
LYKELIGENIDMNDPMLTYMSSLKSQLSNTNNGNKKVTRQINIQRNLNSNSDHSDSNSDEYESGDQLSSPEPSIINSIFEDTIELTNSGSKLNVKIKKFRKY